MHVDVVNTPRVFPDVTYRSDGVVGLSAKQALPTHLFGPLGQGLFGQGGA